jgi:O-antigen ligase
MVMMLPLGLAALFDAALQTVEATPRRGNRIAVLGSPQASAMLLLGVACLVMALSLLMTRSRSGLATFAMGSLLAAAIVFRRQSSNPAKAAVAASVLLLLIGTASWAGLDTMVTKFTEPQGLKSLASRRGAWKDTAAIIRQFPLTGSGLDTYGTAMMLYQTTNPGPHFQEAHNDYLQLAAEGGLLVGVPILIALGVLVRDIRRRFREAPKVGTTYCLRVGAVVGMISIALQSLVEFSLQMPGNAALFAMLAAIALHQSPNLRPVPPSPSGHARPPASTA